MADAPATDDLARLLADAGAGPLICADYTTDDQYPGWYIVPPDAVGTLAKVRVDQEALAHLFALAPVLASEVIRMHAGVTGLRQLVQASKALRDDLLMRAESRLDPASGPKYRVVAARRTAWANFTTALAEAEGHGHG